MPDYKHPAIRLVLFLIAIAGISMLFFYVKGYDTSIGWTLSTETDFEEIVAHEFQKGPFQFQLKGEKVTLSESYYGGDINQLDTLSLVFFFVILIGISLAITSATYFKQFGFLVFSALFLFFLITLQIDIYLGIDKWIAIVPFGALIGLAYGFQSFWTNTTYLLRAGSITLVSLLLVFLIPGGVVNFSVQFFAQGTMPLMIVAFIFIVLVSEELLFGLLFLLTRTRGSKGNQTHMLLLGGIYVANLAGYYLNRAGIFEVPFTFMNPYILLVISTLVACWSFKFKFSLLNSSLHFVPVFIFVMSLGLITFSMLGFGFARGLDGIYEGIHYLVIYSHLAFGFMFLAYIIVNLIDPLAQGLQVYKVVYKPQTFHYVTARLAGLAAVAAFFFLSSQAALNLFHSVRYSLQADMAVDEGNQELAITYLKNADFYGYNTHYPNYQLGSIYLKKNKLEQAREHFKKATQRYPSAQSFLNTSNLQSSADLSLATVHLDRGLQDFPDQPELLNNLGLINWKNGNPQKAYDFFKSTQSEQSWNQAPLANKWGTLVSQRTILSESAEEDFNTGNLVVKTNVLSALLSSGVNADLTFDPATMKVSYPLQRQAFLLNAGFVFSDTSIHTSMKRELEQPVSGLQIQLSRGLAMNQYLTGKVKSSFWSFDRMLIGKSGTIAGSIWNDLGILALDQGAHLEAVDLFEKALEEGFGQAEFNKMVALLEAGKLSLAEIHLEKLIASDSGYLPIKRSLVNVFNMGADTTAEASFNEVYYRFRELEAEEITSKLERFDEGSRNIVLNRIAQENERLQKAHESLGLALLDYSDLDSAAVVSTALEQPFNTGLVLEASRRMKEFDAVAAYNFVSESLEFSKYSIPLLKEQALLTIAIGLPDYGRTALLKLSELMDGPSYSTFEIEWYSAKQPAESDWVGQ